MTGATRAGYDAVAATYAAEVAGELRGKPFDRALLDVLAEHAQGPVLDAGCGPGHVAAYLADRGCTVVGLDLSPAMCAIAAGTVPVVVGDLTALPFGTGALGGLVCAFAVIHLEPAARASAYAEVTRVLQPGAWALLSFHTRDEEAATGETKRLTEWWGHAVDIAFRFLDPVAEAAALERAGLRVVARLERAPLPGVEHASDRAYLMVERPAGR